MEKVNFLMGLHCHQPVDNFKNIFEDAYKKSYEPFLSVLEKHPKIKLSLHYSGSLLDWIVEERPNFVERVKKLIEKNQVEILAGGYFEPILPMVPAEDAKGQIEMLVHTIERHFNFRPTGIWLAERVWDPGLSAIFKDLNIKYTILDDFHLRQAGVKNDGIFGHYLVKGFEDFSVFASIKKLRYAMPFRESHVTIDFLKKLRGDPKRCSVTFGDDCEKFGLWPYTYDWVYKKGWLDRFFTALEENDWIRTLTFTEALSECVPLGEVDIPHSSYAEMAGWCSGNFNNFFKKYPESNLMRKRMLHVSQKIKELQGEIDIEDARKELYKSQSNCAYWHGVFGGVYANYLRSGVYSHIIKAEDAIAKDDKNEKIEMVNLEDSERNIICAQNKFLKLFINPDYAGSLFEIDYKPLAYNLVNTMSRRYEPYHEKLMKKPRINIPALKKKMDEEESVDLYEVLGVREQNLRRFLSYDSYRKFSFLCHAMNPKTSLSDFIKSTPEGIAAESSLFGHYNHEVKTGDGKMVINLKRDSNINIGNRPYLLRINKCIILEKGSEIFIKFDLENLSPGTLKFIFGVEFNWSIEDDLFMKKRREKKVRGVALADKFSGLKINHMFGEPVDLWSFPVYTVNESERGICRGFQQISMLFHRKLALAGKEGFSLETKIRVSG